MSDELVARRTAQEMDMQPSITLRFSFSPSVNRYLGVAPFRCASMDLADGALSARSTRIFIHC